MLAGSAASPFQPQQHLRNAVSARLRRLDARTRTHRPAPGGARRLRRLPTRAGSVGSRPEGCDGPVLDAWVQMIAAARAAGVPVIYTTPVSRADGADVVMLPTDPFGG